jgi:hypothetical protein
VVVTRRMRWAGHVARMRYVRNENKVSKSRWKDKFETHIKETVWESTDWINLAQDRDQWRALVNTAMNIRAT